MDFWSLYWLFTLPAIGETSACLAFFAALGTLVSLGIYAFSYDDFLDEASRNLRKISKRLAGWCASLFFVFCFVTTFIPSKQDLLIIAGVSSLTQLETAQEIGGEAGGAAVKSLKLLNKYLDEELEQD